MVLSTETFNQSVRTEYSEAVNARYTFQPLWVSDVNDIKNSSVKRNVSKLTFLDGYKDIRRKDLCLKTLEKINEEGPRSQHL